MQEKNCARCGKVLPAENFYQKDGKPFGYCKPCVRDHGREYVERNREKVRERKRKWQRDNYPRLALKRRADHLKRAYGITEAEYLDLYDAQGGRCAICGTHRESYVRNLHLDHSHLTGSARGLLCAPCNQVLGWGKDDPSLFLKAAEYLQNYRVRTN